MVTFVDTPTERKEVTIIGENRTLISEIKHKLIREENQRDGRNWLTFPLLLDWERSLKPHDELWLTHYPRLIQWSNGKYYTFAGTHCVHNEVYYKEILIDEGEKIAYYNYMA